MGDEVGENSVEEASSLTRAKNLCKLPKTFELLSRCSAQLPPTVGLNLVKIAMSTYQEQDAVIEQFPAIRHYVMTWSERLALISLVMRKSGYTDVKLWEFFEPTATQAESRPPYPAWVIESAGRTLRGAFVPPQAGNGILPGLKDVMDSERITEADRLEAGIELMQRVCTAMPRTQAVVLMKLALGRVLVEADNGQVLIVAPSGESDTGTTTYHDVLERDKEKFLEIKRRLELMLWQKYVDAVFAEHQKRKANEEEVDATGPRGTNDDGSVGFGS